MISARRKRKRTSGRCKQCSTRKVRCDLSRPRCENCVRLGHNCYYDVPPTSLGSDDSMSHTIRAKHLATAKHDLAAFPRQTHRDVHDRPLTTGALSSDRQSLSRDITPGLSVWLTPASPFDDRTAELAADGFPSIPAPTEHAAPTNVSEEDTSNPDGRLDLSIPEAHCITQGVHRDWSSETDIFARALICPPIMIDSLNDWSEFCWKASQESTRYHFLASAICVFAYVHKSERSDELLDDVYMLYESATFGVSSCFEESNLSNDNRRLQAAFSTTFLLCHVEVCRTLQSRGMNAFADPNQDNDGF